MLYPEILLFAIGVHWRWEPADVRCWPGSGASSPGRGNLCSSVSLTALHSSCSLHPGQLFSSSSHESYGDVLFLYMRSSTLVSPWIPRTAALSRPSWGLIPRPDKSAFLPLFTPCYHPRALLTLRRYVRKPEPFCSFRPCSYLLRAPAGQHTVFGCSLYN